MKELNSKELQAATLELMKKLHDICEKIDVRYFLAYGTLIGAVRHEGFIPWDDDLDIMMSREDYNKLIQYFNDNKNELGSLELFTPETNKDYPYMIARVSDSNYVIDTFNEKDCGMGVFIDIYPLDGFGNDFKSAVKLSKKTFFLSSLYFRSTRLKPQIRDNFSFVRNCIEVGLFFISKLLGKNYLNKVITKLSKTYDYNDSKYIGCVIWHSKIEADIYEKEDFIDLKKQKFEKYEFYIPSKYDYILTKFYGNYMQLPPEEDRVGHHFYKTYIKE